MTTVHDAIIAATTNPFRFKDARKFQHITKFIATGSANSSSLAYAKALESITNTGEYTSNDLVGVSVEGDRRNRIGFDHGEVSRAINAGATIITDNEPNRSRKYNVGEREIALLLTLRNYQETLESGTWQPTIQNYTRRKAC